MLFQSTHYPTGHNCDRTENTIFHTLFQKKKKKNIIDYFKGLLVIHHLNIFMSGKNLGLNGLINELLEYNIYIYIYIYILVVMSKPD